MGFVTGFLRARSRRKVTLTSYEMVASQYNVVDILIKIYTFICFDP